MMDMNNSNSRFRNSQRGYVGGRSSRREKYNAVAGLRKQSYEEIVRKCKEEGCLFEDPEFPAEDASIFYSKSPPRPFEWKRPREISDDPKYVSEGASRFDVKQGMLGDNWLLAAVASLACKTNLLNRVIIPEQGFSSPNYCGVFKFDFWHQGEWIQVVVDDRLPTNSGKLVFLHSTDSKEFWSALLEKAYAKLNGSYESLKGGSTSEAMVDFTGGVTEVFDLKKAPDNLAQIMLKADARSSLMGCSIASDPNQAEVKLDNGLVAGHAYSVTGVKMVNIRTSRTSGAIPMVRVRNPWANEREWKGAWSDSSAEWRLVSDSEKRSLGLTFDDDGEFWMALKDWQNNFTTLEICMLGPDSLVDEASQRIRWKATTLTGEWVPRVSAGGCRNFTGTFATNPQYRVSLTDPDDDDEDDLCTMVVCLLQKDRRRQRKAGKDMLTIGYTIYKVKEENGSRPLDKQFILYNQSAARSPSFSNQREVCGRHKLSPGTYVIIPSTFDPNLQGEFLLRIFTEKAETTDEMDEATSLIEDQEEPPMTEEDRALSQKLRMTFERIAGADMEIDAYELKEVLNAAFGRDFKFDGFGTEVCKSMVAMIDGDLSGKLGFDEFSLLWNDLRKWKGVFKKYDQDNSGIFNSYELRQAFHASGIRLSNGSLKAVVLRFSNKKGEIEFDDFVLSLIRVNTMIASFKGDDPEKQGFAANDLDRIISEILHNEVILMR